MEYGLKGLDDANACTEAIDIQGEDTTWLLFALEKMILIRKSEEKIGDMVLAKKIVCPCHLAIGQEAVAVGVAHLLRKSDRGFGTHRSHSHYLACGGSVEELMAEVLGKVTGCSKGMGGSMHLQSKENGFTGSVPIVAGTVSMAMGAALAAQLDGNHNGKGFDVGIAYFGDGAIEEGGVHESLNLAANFKWPALFVVENNLFSSHLHIRLRQPAERVSRFAEAHKINVEVVDGNDVVAVAKATRRLLAEARNGKGPGFLEAITYRHRGHVGPKEDDDVGLKRKEDLNQWKRRDPIRRLKDALTAAQVLTETQYLAMNDRVQSLVNEAWIKAERAPFPESSALLDLVYALPPHHRGTQEVKGVRHD